MNARYIEEYEVKSGVGAYVGDLGGVESPSEVEEFLTCDAHYTYTLPSGDTSVSVTVMNLTGAKAPDVMHFIVYDARTHSQLKSNTQCHLKSPGA